MKTVQIIRDYQWHQLDPAVGGYASVHVLVSDQFDVITTPVSLEEKEVHFQLLDIKIFELKRDG